ncbi:hypothetical protein AusDCA_2547 [Desulfitobacterium sp. AusDCA]
MLYGFAGREVEGFLGKDDKKFYPQLTSITFRKIHREKG